MQLFYYVVCTWNEWPSSCPNSLFDTQSMYIIYKPDIIIYDDERVASIKYKYTEKYFYATAELKSISIRYGWYIAVDADLFF